MVPDDVTHWSIFGDAACERSLEDSGLGGYKHGYAWRATLEPGDIAGEYKLPITLLEYVVIGVNLTMFGYRNLPLIGSDSLGSFQAVLDLRSKSRAMQFVTNMIAGLSETKRFGDRIAVAHVYGTGNVFADAGSRGNDALVAQLAKALRVTYERLPLTARATRFITDVRQRHRITVDQNRALSAVVSMAAAADVRSAASPARNRTLSSVERGVSKKNRQCVTGDGAASGYDSDELPPFTPLCAFHRHHLLRPRPARRAMVPRCRLRRARLDTTKRLVWCFLRSSRRRGPSSATRRSHLRDSVRDPSRLYHGGCSRLPCRSLSPAAKRRVSSHSAVTWLTSIRRWRRRWLL